MPFLSSDVRRVRSYVSAGSFRSNRFVMVGQSRTSEHREECLLEC